MIHFLNITLQQKAKNDWRAFLDWADGETMTIEDLIEDLLTEAFA